MIMKCYALTILREHKNKYDNKNENNTQNIIKF